MTTNDDSTRPEGTLDTHEAGPGDSPEQATPLEIVEAQIILKRRQFPRVFVAALFGLAATALCVFGYDASLVSSEREAFVHAKDQASAAGWLAYITWAEAQGGWTESRTPIGRHLVYANERLELHQAYAAANAHDRETLCAIIESQNNSPAEVAALRTLRLWLDEAAQLYQHRARVSGVPSMMREVMAVIFIARQREQPCGGSATVRVVEETSYLLDRASDQPLTQIGALVSQHLTSERLAATVAPAAEQLSSIVPNAVPFAVRTRQSEADPTSLIELQVAYHFFPEGEISLPSRGSMRGLGVEVTVTGNAPGVESSDVEAVRYHLADAFGVQLYQAAEAGAEQSELVGLMVDALLTHAEVRLPQSVGLLRYRGSERGHSSCRTMASLVPGVVMYGNNEHGIDVRVSTCEDQPDNDMYEYEDEYDEGMIGQPEEGHKVVVPIRSQLSVMAESDPFDPLVFLTTGCAYSDQEIACNAEGVARLVADEGLYVAWVSSEYAENAGPYSIVTALRSLASIEASCEAEAGTPLVSGQSVDGELGSGDDIFDGACGGTGSPERHYRLQLDERARVRCSVTSPAELFVHARTECGSFESEVGCARDRLELEAPRGTLHIFVDGQPGEGDVEFELLCTTFPLDMQVDGDTCDSAIPLDVSSGEVTFSYDLAPAHASASIACRTGSDLAYTFELAERSYVSVSLSGGGAAVTALSNVCGVDGVSACRQVGDSEVLEPGSAFLVIDVAATRFPAGTATLEVTPFSQFCEGLPLIRTGRLPVPPTEHNPFSPSCSASDRLNDVAYRLRLLHPARVQIASDRSATVAVFQGCQRGREIACVRTAMGPLDEELAAGDYTVVVERAPRTQPTLDVSITRTDAAGD